MGQTIQGDVAIIGAGITGLWATKELAKRGYKVILIEKEDRIAPGPSSRNQGWLHRGTYHAAMIPNFLEAKNVSHNCAEGYSKILQYAPETIEERASKTYALIRNEDIISEVVSRWKGLGIPHKSISKSHTIKILPEIKTKNIVRAFEVSDLSINTKMLYGKLLKTSRDLGAKLLLKTKFSFASPNMGRLLSQDGRISSLKVDKFIVCAGYNSPKLFEEITQKPLKMLFWQSHLLIFPRLTKNNVFYLDSDEATIMNHGKISVVSRQQDAVQILKINHRVNSKRAQSVFNAVERLVRNAANYKNDYLATSCIKPELVDRSNASLKYSVDLKILKATSNHIFAFPGKMTEAPHLVKKILEDSFKES